MSALEKPASNVASRPSGRPPRPRPARPATEPVLIKTIYEYDRPLTLEEFERLPEGEGKQELHDGRVVEMAPVGLVHGELVVLLAAALLDHVRRQSRRQGRQIGRVTTETGYALWRDRPHASRAPDVAFIRADRVPHPFPRKGLVRAVPDLAVEVLSPDDPLGEVQTKIEEYLERGVQLVWVIDPFVEVRVYRPTSPAEPVARLTGDDVLSGEEVLPGFAIPLPELWPVIDEPLGEAGDAPGDE
jgi:Uma2 family endonuclease